MRTPAIPQLEFEFPTLMVPRGDGTFLIKPGKPVVKEEEITTGQAAKILGRTIWRVYKYVDEGLLTAKQPMKGGRYRLSRSEVELLANKIKE